MTQTTASIVSHGHGALISLQLDDIARNSQSSLAQVVITLNIPELWAPPATVAGVPITMIRNPRPLGFAANHNNAFAHCRTPVFAVLNPDLRLPRDPFPRLATAALQDGCGLAVPWQVDSAGRMEDFRRRVPTPMSLGNRMLTRWRDAANVPTATAELEWVAGACMALRSEAFAAVGGFDAAYRLYCEDVDLCLRLQLAGWRIQVVEDMAVIHDARRKTRESPRHLFWHLRSLLRLWRSPAFATYLERRRRH